MHLVRIQLLKIINVLEMQFNVKTPTKIQRLSIEKIRSFSIHHLIAAETGCGKTLAYVIPIIEEIMNYKKTKNVNRGFNEPISLVIVPTRELAFQAYQVFKKFVNEHLNFRVVVDLGYNMIHSKEILTEEIFDSKLKSSHSPPDIVISTPSRLKTMFFQNKNYIMSTYLRKLVIDEANLLLDDSNSSSILKIINYLNLNLSPMNNDGTLCKNSNTQILFVSATIPRDMKKILETVLDVSTELEVISTNKINKIMLHVPQHFLRLLPSTKGEKLLEIIKKNPRDSVMIFSNKKETAIFVYKFLLENDIKVCLFIKQAYNERDISVQKFFNGECNVISCTDIASRGLDTLHVKHVINFEMPTFIADYVHRIGRVGRMSSDVKGAKVTNFISKPYEVETVWNIEQSIRKNCDLENLNANIKRILHYRYEPKYQDKTADNQYKESENENKNEYEEFDENELD